MCLAVWTHDCFHPSIQRQGMWPLLPGRARAGWEDLHGLECRRYPPLYTFDSYFILLAER